MLLSKLKTKFSYLLADTYNVISTLRNIAMKIQSHISALAFILILCLSIPTLSFAAVSVGKVKMVLGKVTLINNQGSEKRLRRGTKLKVGDIIVTSKRGQAQITMIDGTKISVRPASKFLIEEFIAIGPADKQKTYYKLLKGGFRSVTGKIGKKNKQSFRLSTPVATMGIRGTDFTGKYCSSDCPATGGKDGLFIDVISGGVSMTNDNGTLVLDKDTNGYVASANDSPENIETLPANLLSPKATETKVGDRYPSPEEEMVQVALYENPEDKDTILSDAMDADVSPTEIIRGATNAGLEPSDFIPQLIEKGEDKGMEPSDFIIPILNSGMEYDTVINDMMTTNPDSASDILTAAIATGEFDNNILKESAATAGVSETEIENADTVGNLFALPKEVKELLKSDSATTEDAPIIQRSLDIKELAPTGNTGTVASPS